MPAVYVLTHVFTSAITSCVIAQTTVVTLNSSPLWMFTPASVVMVTVVSSAVWRTFTDEVWYVWLTFPYDVYLLVYHLYK